MANKKNNMDQFLRESLGDLAAKPSQSVWKGITKRLILLELLRLNFTNLSKAWLYSGLATIATISGVTYFSLSHQTEENPQTAKNTQTEQITSKPEPKETFNIVSEVSEEKTSELTEPTEDIQKTVTPSQPKKMTTVKETEVTKVFEESDKKRITENKNNGKRENKVAERPTEQKELWLLPIEAHAIEMITISETKPVLTGVGRGQMRPHLFFEEDAKQVNKPKNKNLSWTIAASYNPEWPLTNEDMFVNNHQFSIHLGAEYKKWQFSAGIGIRNEKTPSMFASEFYSYDSIGFFYDIEYFEIDPENNDSIVLFYNIESLYDSVTHESHSHGPDQSRRWIFIPVSLGYEVLSSSKYQLYANIFGQYGWQTYLEEADMSLQVASGSQITNITPESNPNYLQIGIGLENNFNLISDWWIFAEPKINYYINTPYSINQTTGNGPYNFGLEVGIKYKIRRK